MHFHDAKYNNMAVFEKKEKLVHGAKFQVQKIISDFS